MRQAQQESVDIEWVVRDGVAHVTVRGDLGHQQAGRLGEVLSQVCALWPRLVVADLSQVAFISSVALGALMSFRNSLSRHGGRLSVGPVSPQVGDVFRRVRFDCALPVTRRDRG